MGFGKRKEKKGNKDETKHSENIDKNNKRSNSKTSSSNCNSNSNNSGCHTPNISIKQKRASGFIRKIGKGKTSNILLFAQTKEEKLEQFIKNMNIIHPNMPRFWQQKDIDKFKKRFNI